MLLALIGVTTTVQAADCRINGGPWQRLNPGDTVRLTVPVTVRLTPAPDRILLEGVNLECRFTQFGGAPSFEDYWVTSTSAWVAGPKFSGQSTGVRINGTDRNNPIPVGIRVATNRNNGAGVPIAVTPFILLRNDPSNPIDVRTGDALGTLTLDQTNNYDSTRTRLLVTYNAANNFTVSPSTCTINNNNPIVIDFGNVHQRVIGNDPLTTSIRSDRTLTYNCSGPINSQITITYQGTPSSFNPNLLMMTHPNLGTALVRAGSAVRVGGSFLTTITNGVGQDTVTFSLVTRAGSLPATGPVIGSGVLVMGVP